MQGTRAQIRDSVEALLRRTETTTAPVPVERIARHLGAQVTYEPFEGELSGLLFREEDHIVIGVNASHPKTRQRFTIAHEIGHLCLHSNEDIHIDRIYSVHMRDEKSARAVDPKEIAANAFAAELLMPTEMIRRDVRSSVVDYEDDEVIRYLADLYAVSLQAMTIRLTNLGYITPAVDAGG